MLYKMRALLSVGNKTKLKLRANVRDGNLSANTNSGVCPERLKVGKEEQTIKSKETKILF